MVHTAKVFIVMKNAIANGEDLANPVASLSACCAGVYVDEWFSWSCAERGAKSTEYAANVRSPFPGFAVELTTAAAGAPFVVGLRAQPPVGTWCRECARPRRFSPSAARTGSLRSGW